MRVGTIPSKIRVSLGSAILLGLTGGIIDAKPSTIYLLTYRTERCIANCSFCSQARSSTSRADRLSRVIWPVFPTSRVIDQMKKMDKNEVHRVCIQAMNYPDVFVEILGLVRRIHAEVNTPISISCQPLNIKQISELKEAGVDRVGIPLDVPTERLFEEVKGSEVGGPYRWKRSIEALGGAVQVLGKGKVSTHLIVGLSESDEELIRMIQRVIDMGVYPALFAFTPIPGTKLEWKGQPRVDRYRCIQLARYLLVEGNARFEEIIFNNKGRIRGLRVNRKLLGKIIKTGVPFMTSGCHGCNRPFYNERVSGPIYNYPRPLTKAEIEEVKTSIWRYLSD